MTHERVLYTMCLRPMPFNRRAQRIAKDDTVILTLRYGRNRKIAARKRMKASRLLQRIERLLPCWRFQHEQYRDDPVQNSKRLANPFI